MDENEWLKATDPTPMLAFLREKGRPSDRKLRLFACACVRRIWQLLVDERSRQAVEVAERFADGLAAYAELDRAYQAAASLVGVAEVAFHPDADAANAAGNAASPVIVDGLYFAPAHAAAAAVKAAAEFAVLDLATSEELAPMRTWVFARDSERSAQAALLRDIVANPFAPLRPIDAAWLRWDDCTVFRIATGIYEERAFERMGVLADALLDSGCDDEDMLAHCRQQEGVHARGCWVIALLLGMR